MMIELVSHCWQWRYSRLLIYQLSSLVVDPPQATTVTITVFFTPEDSATTEVVEYFTARPVPPTLRVRPWPLPRGQLLRRLIGRNLAALSTSADWIWFTDCDYCFGATALDALPDAVRDVEEPLVMPRLVWVNPTHAEGDGLIEAASGEPQVRSLDTDGFVPAHYRRAIGGVQIARGDVVRQAGYCRNSRRQNWTADTWQREIEDRQFRVGLGTSGIAVEIPHVYRIRHSPRSE